MLLAAEFALPKSEGDSEDGRLTVSEAGGTVEENVKRWRGQFGGKPEKDTQQELDIAGLKITVVDFVGNFNDSMAGIQRSGYRMLGAVIPGGERLIFVKAYGPQKTMGDHEDAFHSFLQSLQKQ